MNIVPPSANRERTATGPRYWPSGGSVSPWGGISEETCDKLVEEYSNEILPRKPTDEVALSKACEPKLIVPHHHGDGVSLVVIKRSWSPRVRYAGRKYKRAVRKAQRAFERSVASGTSEGEAMSELCVREASAVLELLKRLGYGGGKLAPARDRLELEVMVHERDESPSINFFRLFLAQRKGIPVEQAFSRRGRERYLKEAEDLRWRHIEELGNALKARRAAHAWLSQYYGRLEIGKKYREFARVQFDKEMDDDAKVAYMSLLFAQIAQRTDRTPEDVLEEFNSLVSSLDISAAAAEIDLGGEWGGGRYDATSEEGEDWDEGDAGADDGLTDSDESDTGQGK